MARHNPEIERLGQVLDKSLKRMEISTRLDEYGVWPIWNDIVGTTIARNAQPEKIRNGTLFVKVTSPVWMQQLQYMKEMIAEKLNQRLKTDVVKNIFFEFLFRNFRNRIYKLFSNPKLFSKQTKILQLRLVILDYSAD